MRFNHSVFLFVVGLLAIGVMAGCGQSKSNSPSSPAISDFVAEGTQVIGSLKVAKLMIPKTAVLLTNGQDVIIEADELISEEGSIASFLPNIQEPPGVNGKPGGKITIRTKKASGKLTIYARGTSGGNGADGANGSNGADAQRSGPFFFHKERGADGTDGRDGQKGGDGGNTAMISIEILQESSLDLSVVQEPGLAGKGGHGGAGGYGGIGTWNGQNGKAGQEGASGIPGKNTSLSIKR